MLNVSQDQSPTRQWSGRANRWLEAGEPVPHDSGGVWYTAKYGDGPECSSDCPLRAAVMALEFAATEGRGEG